MMGCKGAAKPCVWESVYSWEASRAWARGRHSHVCTYTPTPPFGTTKQLVSCSPRRHQSWEQPRPAKKMGTRGPPSLRVSVHPFSPSHLPLLLPAIPRAWEGLEVHGQTAYWADRQTVCSIQPPIQAWVGREGSSYTVALQWLFIQWEGNQERKKVKKERKNDGATEKKGCIYKSEDSVCRIWLQNGCAHQHTQNLNRPSFYSTNSPLPPPLFQSCCPALTGHVLRV